LKNSTAMAIMPTPTLPCSEKTTRTIRRKIGNTVYRVSVHFSDTSKERMEDKILRMASNDVSGLSNISANTTKNSLKNDIKCGILDLPQTGRLLDGGSL